MLKENRLAAGCRPPKMSGTSPSLKRFVSFEMQSWFPFISESASTLSGDSDALYFYFSGVTVFFVTLISLVVIFFVIRYRRRNAFEIPRPIEGSHKLEMRVTVMTLTLP